MTYCNEKQMPCEWARIGGGCSVSACRKILFTHGGWPMPIEQPEFVKPQKTNADHIRSMTDEELAEWFDRGFCGSRSLAECRGFNGGCAVCVLDWLKQPYKEDA